MIAARSHPSRRRSDATPDYLRSRVTNGSCLVPGVDNRSAWMRRYRDLIVEHVADLGGADYVTAAELVLVRRAAMLTLQLEIMETRFALAEGGAAKVKQLDAYQRATNTLRRALETLGLERRMKDVTPGGRAMEAATARIVAAIEGQANG
jgi:hypothetical protein